MQPPKRQMVPPFTWIVAAVLTVILAAILITNVSQVRNGGNRRTIDSSNIRQIGQAALIYAMEREGRLPETNLGPDGVPADGETTNVHRFAAALAREISGFDNWYIYYSAFDQHPGVSRPRNSDRVMVRENDGIQINPEFLNSGISYQLVGGLTLSMPRTTPIGFTRGLREDGRWDRENGVYGDQGGHLVYLGGHVQWRRNLEPDQIWSSFDEETLPTNILERLTPEQSIYGAPDPPIPDGTRGRGPPTE